jgi:hypothetical protein
MSDGRQILARTALTLCDPQEGRLKFISSPLFREFLGREITHALNRDRIILECQFERPSAVFVLGVLHAAGDSPVANCHGVDIIKISRLQLFVTLAGGSDSGNGCQRKRHRPPRVLLIRFRVRMAPKIPRNRGACSTITSTGRPKWKSQADWPGTKTDKRKERT